MTYGELIAAMRDLATQVENEPSVVAAHKALLAQTGLSEKELTRESFSRVRLAFEATRDGGLWGIRWDITDQMPWSDRIWQQWSDFDFSSVTDETITAVAECDELSALFAMVARDLGIDGFVGLHWPAWNHVVAVWELQGDSKQRVRVLVPTSQVWLSREATLGTNELPTNRVVFPYARKDQKLDAPLSAVTARFLIRRLQRHATDSTTELLGRRNALGGS